MLTKARLTTLIGIGAAAAIIVAVVVNFQYIQQLSLGQNETIDAQTLNGLTVDELLALSKPLDAKTLNGQPGLYYVQAEHLVGIIAPERFSAYDSLVKQGKIAPGSELVTNKNFPTVPSTPTSQTPGVSEKKLEDLAAGLRVEMSQTYVSEMKAGLGLSGGGGFGKVTLNIVPGAGIIIQNGQVTAALGNSVDLLTEVTGVLSLANGGTGLSSVIADGQLLMANGGIYEGGILAAGDGVEIVRVGNTFTYSVDATVCRTAGNCSGSGGSLVGAGTAGQVAFFTDGNTLSSEAGLSWNSATDSLSVSGQLNGASVSSGWVDVTSQYRVNGVALNTTHVLEGTNLYWTQGRFDSALAGKDSDDVAEGSTNLFWTLARFNTALSGKTTTDLAEGTNLYWTQGRFDTAFLAKDTDDLAEGATALYWTNNRFDLRLATKSTTDIAEGSNLYWTNVRFDNAFSGKSTTDVAEGVNLYFTDGRVSANDDVEANTLARHVATTVSDSATIDFSIIGQQISGSVIQSGIQTSLLNNDAGFISTVSLASFDTDDLAEGSTNRYFSDVLFGDSFATRDSDDLAEGETNFYFTLARFNTALSGVDSDDISEGSTNLYWTTSRFTTAVSGLDSDDIAEGAVNLYFTTERFDTEFGNKTSDDLAEGSGNRYYSDALFGTSLALRNSDDLAEGSTNLYYSLSRFDTAFDSKTTDDLDEGTGALYWTDNRFDLRLATKSTSDISEGSNLYYTQNRFDLAFADKSTTDLAEGVNLYYTDGRVSANADVEANTLARHAAATVSDSSTIDFSLVGQLISGTVIQSGIQTSLLNNDAGFISSISLASFDTDDLSEGVVNLYWTADRFNTAFGGMSTTDLTEGANLYYTQVRFDADFAAKDSDDLAEGTTNLFSQWLTNGSNVTFGNSVAIGTTEAPLATLDINGTAAISGAVTLANYTTNGGILYANGSGALSQLGVGTSGQCLVSTGGVPGWGSCAEAGTVTGNGTVGQLAFFDGTNSLSGSSALTWDLGDSELTINGSISMTGDIIPTEDNVYSLGSPSMAWMDVYIGPGSLYINGQKVLQESGESIVVTADPGQNLVLQTASGGDLEFTASGGGLIQLKSNVQLTGGNSITTSDTSVVLLPSGLRAGNIQVSGNVVTTTNTNGDIAFTPNGAGDSYFTNGNVGIGNSSPSYRLDVTGNINTSGNFLVGGSAISTSNVVEGTNLYYTQGRFDTAFAGKDSDDLDEGSINQFWSEARFIGAFGSMTTDDLAEGVTALYWTDNRFDLRLATKDTDDVAEGSNLYYTAGRFDTAFAGKSTTDLTEGVNLYFTDQRVSDSTDVAANTLARHVAATVSDSSTIDFSIIGQQISGTIIQSGIQTSLINNDAGFISSISLASFDSDDLAEGSLNLYWTTDRFNAAFGGKSTTDLAEGTNLYYTTVRFDADFATKDSDDLAEGSTNLFSQWLSNGSDVTFGNSVAIGSADAPTATLDLTGSLKVSGAVTLANFTTAGGLLYVDGSGSLTQLGTGLTDECLVSTGGTPVWGACGASLPSDNVTGNGANGRLAFWNGTYTQSSDDAFVWNSASNILTVGIHSGSPTRGTFQAIGNAYYEIASLTGDELSFNRNQNMEYELSANDPLRLGMNDYWPGSNCETELELVLDASGYGSILSFCNGAVSGGAQVSFQHGSSSVNRAEIVSSAGIQLSATDDVTIGGTSDLVIAGGGLTINAFTTAGGLLYTDGSGVVSQLSAGLTDQCLLSTGGTPTWGSCGDELPSDNVTGSGSSGRIAFWNGTNTQTSDSNLFWDNTNKRLGVGTAGPGEALTVSGNILASGAISTSAGGAAGSGTQALASYSYVQSRGMNLVANGTGMLGNNYNFSSFTFDQVDTYTGKGSFRNSTNGANVTSDELMPIDPSKSYSLSLWAKSTTYVAGNRAYFGLMPYDIDGNIISARNNMRQAGTDTTLAADLNPGDTTISLTSAANWNNAAGSSGHFRSVSVYGYSNSFGYTYPDYTYTRRVVSNAYADGGVNYGTNIITLSSPWPATWGVIPAGTAISNGSDGGNYKYTAASNAQVPTSWTRYSGEIGGMDTTGTNRNSQFQPGTASVKVLFLMNREVSGNATNVSAVSFSEVAGRNINDIDLGYDATEVGLTIKGAVGQSVDLLQLKNSSGTTLARFDSAGNLIVSATGSSTFAGSVTSAGMLTASNGFTLTAGSLSLPNNVITDAMVSNTLTSSIFIGSGSTTNAVDLGTAEVAGTLAIANGGTNSTATPTQGGIAYGTGSAYAFTAAGTVGQCLQSNGTSAPTWGVCGVEAEDLSAGGLVFADENGKLVGSGIDASIFGSTVAAQDSTSLNAVAYGNGRYVAVGGYTAGGAPIITSTDGQSWTAVTDAPDRYWSSITYANGVFVAVSDEGDINRVITSPDGVTWTSQAAAEANAWVSVTYGGGQFVAVAAAGTNRVMTSPDGVTWTARSAAEANGWRDVVYGGGQFVAVANGGTNRVMTSPDGVTWTARSAAEANGWASITYGGGQFLAVATSGTNRVMTSPDGVTWTARSATEANSWFSVTYGDSQFVAVSSSGTNRVMTSPDGVTWTAYATPEQNSWFDVIYSGTQFVSVAGNGLHKIMTSENGQSWSVETGVYKQGLSINAGLSVSSLSKGGYLYSDSEGNIYSTGGSVAGFDWTLRDSPVVEMWSAVSYGNGVFAAVGDNGGMYSSDGVSWQATTLPEENTYWRDMVYGNGLFVAVAASGDATNKVMTSIDGVTWTGRSAAEANTWNSVAYGKGLFVAVASSGTNRVMTSPDGITWTPQSADGANSWFSVTYGNGLFVAVASSGQVMTSPDGINWTARSAAAAYAWRSVTYGNGLFVAVASTAGDDKVMVSSNGADWELGTIPTKDGTTLNLFDVVYANGRFIAISASGSIVSHSIYSSVNGLDWEGIASPSGGSWQSVAYGNGMLVAIGYPAVAGANLIMTSGSTTENVVFSNNVYQGGMTVNGGLVTNSGLTISSFTANGGLLYTNGSGVVAQLAAGTTGQCLQANAEGAPTWGTCFTIADDALDFDKMADALTLDASTSINLGANDFSTSGTGGIAFGHTGDTSFAGNVGIGTATPEGTLHLWGHGTNGSQSVMYFGDRDSSSNPYIGEFGIGDSDKLALQGRLGTIINYDGGNVGIGANDSPSAKLHVTSTSATSNGLLVTANSLSTGKGLSVSSTSTAMTTGGLIGLDWSPGSATTMTGDLLSVNVGANGTVGNLLNLMNNGLSVFSVSQTQITANVPVAFMAAGDMSVAYDLYFSNPTTGNIKSAGPLSIKAGETFGSSNLTFQTYNSGSIVFDSQTIQALGVTTIGSGGNTITLSETGLIYAGTARPTKTITLSPEYTGSNTITDGSGTTNGAFAMGNGGSGASWRNYYEWTSGQASLQDYTIAVRVTLPTDFDEWDTTAFSLEYQTGTASTSDNAVSVQINEASQSTAACSLTTDRASTSWTTTNMTCAGTILNDGSNDWDAAGQTAIIRIKVKANNTGGAFARVGDIKLQYKARF